LLATLVAKAVMVVCSSLERASALLVRHTDLCFAHANCDAAGEAALTEACAQAEPEPLALHRLQTAYGLFRTLYRKLAAVPTPTYDWRQHQAVDDRLGPWAQRAKRTVRGTGRPAAEVIPGPRPALGAARALAAAPTCALGAALGRGPGPLGDLVVLRCTERVLARLPLLLARLHGCVGTVYVHEVCRGGHRGPPEALPPTDGREALLGVVRLLVDRRSSAAASQAAWLG
jgi:hypothetical protein